MPSAILAVALALSSVAMQDKPAPTPQKGDSVIVKGCLRGNSLEATETGVVDAEARMMTALVYRLTGEKKLLKQLRADHDGKVVEVSGVLKSKLPSAGQEHGFSVGNTRVRVGVGSPHAGSPAAAEMNRSIPVLEVKSYEGVPVQCGS